MPEKRTLKEVEGIILSFLDELDDKNERVKKIGELVDRLEFERRLALLTEEEMQHMLDETLSPEQQKALKEVNFDEIAFNARVEMYARAKYFRRCEWTDYLNGKAKDKPFTSFNSK